MWPKKDNLGENLVESSQIFWQYLCLVIDLGKVSTPLDVSAPLEKSPL